MKSIETQGKTVDQAIELGLYKLGVTRQEVKITILEEAGLFNKAKVRLALNTSSDEETKVKTLVEEFVSKMGLDLDIYVEEAEDCFKVDLTGEDAALAIGKHGDCLESLSNLINAIYNKGKDRDESKRVIVDSNNYRARREDTLTILAKKMASKAIREGRNTKLEPMTSYERRIIHNALSGDDRVETESQGNEPNRYVVIKIAGNADRRKEKSIERKAEEETQDNNNRSDND